MKKKNNWYLNDNLLMRNGYLIVPCEKSIQDFVNDYKEMYNEIYLLQQERDLLRQNIDNVKEYCKKELEKPCKSIYDYEQGTIDETCKDILSILEESV